LHWTESQYDLMTLAYQHFTVVLLIYGSLFLSSLPGLFDPAYLGDHEPSK